MLPAEDPINSKFGAFNAVPTDLAPIAEEHPPASNGWGFHFGSNAQRNKKCVATIIEDLVMEPAPKPDEVKEEEGPRLFLFSNTNSKKKKKRATFIARADDGWGTSALTGKKGKKKKGKKPSPPTPDPEPAPEPAPALAEDDPCESLAILANL
ncbi:hypothetical protein BU23DRAFT_661253 [Bimuria novae-zelandiae CBS 107.79]|uniref:Uncharacterized protein n=1 Tax=Bimuria novae-zelandiae CBS 107.79 TaxID=1447943 RepID=A0A6A5UQ65_9PLEO|nr:hypothetical protein BU23DRAFT_661253 [Bimuria novae-zelandiae CBS 107.79]